MTAKDCLKAKISTGRVSRRAGAKILAIMRDAEARAKAGDETALRAAHEEAAKIAAAEAVRKEAVALGSIIAQTNVLRAAGVYRGAVNHLRQQKSELGIGSKAPLGLQRGQSTLLPAMRSLLVRDAGEIATWDNVYYLGTELRKESMARFAAGIEYLRPKKLGLAPETLRETEVLDALFGRAASPESKAVADAFTQEAERVRAEFNKAAGYEAIPERKDWRIGNPSMDQAKVLAWTREAFSDRVTPLLDREKMIDFKTGAPLSDDRLREVLFDVHETARTDGAEGQPNAGYVGAGPLSARRSAQRVLMFKGPDEWRAFNDAFGSGVGVFDTMMRHFASMAHDTSIMRVLGPDPNATKRFILSLFDRETAALAKQGDPADPKSMAAAVVANKKIASNVESGRDAFETYWAHMTGEASIPVNAAAATMLGDARAAIASAQLGGALLSSFADLGTLAATARFNDLPVTATLKRAVEMLADGEAEITAMQAGVVADSIAHGVGGVDRYMGETLRAGLPAKMSAAVMRASGLRRWSSILRASFGLEFMAQMANHIRKGTAFEALPFRASLERYGIGPDDWARVADAARTNGMWAPRANAEFLRPMDARAWGESRAGNALGRMLQSEIDFTAIEGDPMARAALYGRTAPGTATGEIRRAFGMYKSFPITVLLTHGNRAFARGWDAKRLSHAGYAFVAMTLFGMLSFQAKEIASGRDPVTMDATTTEGRRAWLHAVMQGGGLGPLGDIVTQDKTRYGNSWAAFLGGPLLSTTEDIAGQWALKNIQLAVQGRETHFLGDALWIGARYVPGSSLWYAKLAYQRAIQDQLLLQFDERAYERFGRIEQRAREDFHQDYWWRRGEATPARAPAIGGAP
jgi:hypothetical protein